MPGRIGLGGHEGGAPRVAIGPATPTTGAAAIGGARPLEHSLDCSAVTPIKEGPRPSRIRTGGTKQSWPHWTAGIQVGKMSSFAIERPAVVAEIRAVFCNLEDLKNESDVESKL